MGVGYTQWVYHGGGRRRFLRQGSKKQMLNGYINTSKIDNMP